MVWGTLARGDSRSECTSHESGRAAGRGGPKREGRRSEALTNSPFSICARPLLTRKVATPAPSAPAALLVVPFEPDISGGGGGGGDVRQPCVLAGGGGGKRAGGPAAGGGCAAAPSLVAKWSPPLSRFTLEKASPPPRSCITIPLLLPCSYVPARPTPLSRGLARRLSLGVVVPQPHSHTKFARSAPRSRSRSRPHRMHTCVSRACTRVCKLP
jgi:hypothetical protein